jgi:hypothetical protein
MGLIQVWKDNALMPSWGGKRKGAGRPRTGEFVRHSVKQQHSSRTSIYRALRRAKLLTPKTLQFAAARKSAVTAKALDIASEFGTTKEQVAVLRLAIKLRKARRRLTIATALIHLEENGITDPLDVQLRKASKIYPTLKGRWVRRGGFRMKLVQDCAVIAVAVACSVDYDTAFKFLEADKDGGVSFLGKLNGTTLNGWRITHLKSWRSKMTKAEFPKLFPIGRYLCSEYRHLAAYIDGVRFSEGLRTRAQMLETWKLERD